MPEHRPLEARVHPMPPAGLPRVRPRRPAVWIHVGGGWRSGWVSAWVWHEGRWLCWAQHDYPECEPWTRWAWYEFDPATVMARDGTAPPPAERGADQ